MGGEFLHLARNLQDVAADLAGDVDERRGLPVARDQHAPVLDAVTDFRYVAQPDGASVLD